MACIRCSSIGIQKAWHGSSQSLDAQGLTPQEPGGTLPGKHRARLYETCDAGPCAARLATAPTKASQRQVQTLHEQESLGLHQFSTGPKPKPKGNGRQARVKPACNLSGANFYASRQGRHRPSRHQASRILSEASEPPQKVWANPLHLQLLFAQISRYIAQTTACRR